jgi:hypothetical protein
MVSGRSASTYIFYPLVYILAQVRTHLGSTNISVRPLVFGSLVIARCFSRLHFGESLFEDLAEYIGFKEINPAVPQHKSRDEVTSREQ